MGYSRHDRLDRDYRLGDPLHRQRPDSMYNQALKVLAGAVGFDGVPIAVDFPQSKNAGLFLTAADPKFDDARLFDRGVAQLSQKRLSLVGVFRRKRKVNRGNNHLPGPHGNGQVLRLRFE